MFHEPKNTANLRCFLSSRSESRNVSEAHYFIGVTRFELAASTSLR